jgi:glucuronoarabinoxylan endo-1,4-beta-xylanase
MKFMRNILNWRVLMDASVVLVTLSCPAGVTVTQNVAPGATSWPGSPIIQTVTNPAVQVAVGESFNAVGGCTNYTQTFTGTGTDYTLQTISIYAGGGTGTGGGTNLTLRLFDLGTQTAPNPSPYSPGSDLFNSGNGLAITYTPQTVGVLQFDFTGSDQVTLTNGRLYAFEINGPLNSSPLGWQRTISDTYVGGAAYRDRAWINGNNAREFALAVYGAAPVTNPPPNTNTTLVKFEAESGTLGADWAVSNGVPNYITILTDGAGDNPGSAARVATYAVTFPRPGTYDLYVRLRVGPGGANDDSLFYGNGFGVKSPTLAADWITLNGLGTAGFVTANNIVTGGGTAGANVWKWLNLSQFAAGGAAFSVASGNLTRTFQIGARENGLDFDAFVFGINGVRYTVAELDAGAGGTFPDGTSTLNWNDPRQEIDGFGAGVVFLNDGSALNSSNADTLFRTNTANQLGLTLLRVRIAPNNTWSNSVSAWTSSVNEAKLAVARGASVLATPWSPPAYMKSNGDINNGGNLLPEQYASYAAYLEKYASNMVANGVSLAAISVQNEPDYSTDYESCVWSAAQFLSFFRTNAATIRSAPLIMPESVGLNFALANPSLNDPIAVTNIALIGHHLYGVTQIAPNANAAAKGKKVWQTEFLINDQGLETSIQTAAQVHDCLTTGNMSAYIWWKALGNINGLLNAVGVIQKRGYVMAQFSRFVRPGYFRIAEINTGSGRVSAYKNPSGTQFAIIAINPYSLDFNQTITLNNFPGIRLTPWVTSATQSLAVQSSFIVTNSTLTFSLPANSIVTFVGELLTNTPPTFAAGSPLTVNPGVTVVLTNTVTDADLPGQTLAFTLLTAPTNATLTPLTASNVVFTWRPLLSQSGSTNPIQIKVTDNGTPNLSATNNFVITVNPATEPGLSSIALGSQVNLSATGMIGPDYLLFTSTNLVSWQLLSTTNPAVMPVTFTDTNLTDPARFYRLQLGP